MKDYQAVRDVGALYAQYQPLRMALLREYRPYLTNEHTREELESFIKEHFIRLCYEYDTVGEVDFAGYIKIMLGMRIKYSFVGKEYKDVNRMKLGKHQDISETYERRVAPDLDYQTLVIEFKDLILSSAQFSPLSERILDYVLEGCITNEIINRLSEDLPEYFRVGSSCYITLQDLKHEIQSVRGITKLKGEEWLT